MEKSKFLIDLLKNSGLVDLLPHLASIYNTTKYENRKIPYPSRFLSRKKLRNKVRREGLPTKRQEGASNEFNIIDEFSRIHKRQEDTNNKLNYLISMISRKKSKKINNLLKDEKFGFEIVSEPKNDSLSNKIYDYFSFKIKPDLSLNLNASSVANEFKLQEFDNFTTYKKSHSPNKLRTHKFFEDTEAFRNINLMSVKTLQMNTSSINPFTTSNKSDSELHGRSNSQTYRNILLSTNKKVKSPEESNIDITENQVNNELSFMKDDISISMTNLSELENTEKKQDLTLTKIEEKSIMTQSNGNETISQCSSKYVANSSQGKISPNAERFKQVRGFNFKNNINTKKFTKPLFGKDKSSSQEIPLSDDCVKPSESLNHQGTPDFNSSQNVEHVTREATTPVNVAKSENFIDRSKIKRFNFNNNVNIKKFMRQDSGREKEKQFEYEDNSISVDTFSQENKGDVK